MSITDRRLFDHDPLTGTTQYFYSDAAGENFVIERVEDVEPMIEFNKAVFNLAPSRWGDGKLVAQYPLTIWHSLKQQGILDDDTAYRRWLNDSDNAVFRTRPGRV